MVVEPPAPTVTERIPPVKRAASQAVPAASRATKRPPRKASAKRVAAGTRRTWVEPTGTDCPTSHPVKAKLASMIYHLPGMAAYNRTRPDRCYRDGPSAESDGFIRSKR